MIAIHTFKQTRKKHMARSRTGRWSDQEPVVPTRGAHGDGRGREATPAVGLEPLRVPGLGEQGLVRGRGTRRVHEGGEGRGHEGLGCGRWAPE